MESGWVLLCTATYGRDDDDDGDNNKDDNVTTRSEF